MTCWRRIVPVKDKHRLGLAWPLPEQISKYLSNSDGYLSHLFGYEGKGSMLSLLKVLSPPVCVTPCPASLLACVLLPQFHPIGQKFYCSCDRSVRKKAWRSRKRVAQAT